MKLEFTEHLKTRLKQRGIPTKIVKDAFNQNLASFWDNLRNHHITTGVVDYQGKRRKVLVAYDKIDENTAAVITIHPITDQQIKQRLKSGRWSYEKDKG